MGTVSSLCPHGSVREMKTGFSPVKIGTKDEWNELRDKEKHRMKKSLNKMLEGVGIQNPNHDPPPCALDPAALYRAKAPLMALTKNSFMFADIQKMLNINPLLASRGHQQGLTCLKDLEYCACDPKLSDHVKTQKNLKKYFENGEGKGGSTKKSLPPLLEVAALQISKSNHKDGGDTSQNTASRRKEGKTSSKQGTRNADNKKLEFLSTIENKADDLLEKKIIESCINKVLGKNKSASINKNVIPTSHERLRLRTGGQTPSSRVEQRAQGRLTPEERVITELIHQLLDLGKDLNRPSGSGSLENPRSSKERSRALADVLRAIDNRSHLPF